MLSRPIPQFPGATLPALAEAGAVPSPQVVDSDEFWLAMSSLMARHHKGDVLRDFLHEGAPRRLVHEAFTLTRAAFVDHGFRVEDSHLGAEDECQADRWCLSLLRTVYDGLSKSTAELVIEFDVRRTPTGGADGLLRVALYENDLARTASAAMLTRNLASVTWLERFPETEDARKEFLQAMQDSYDEVALATHGERAGQLAVELSDRLSQ